MTLRVRYRGRGTGLRLDDHGDTGPIPLNARILDCGRAPQSNKAFRIFVQDRTGHGSSLDLTAAETLLLIEAALNSLTPDPEGSRA
jgi:hypothetical protein